MRVIKGRVWDVAVDIRPGSASYGKWLGVELSEENHLMLYTPPGFAHGFASLSNEVHLCTSARGNNDPALDAGYTMGRSRPGNSVAGREPPVVAEGQNPAAA